MKILRQIVFIITIAYILLFAMGVDSIYDNGYFFIGMLIMILLVTICILLKTNKLFEK